MNDSPADNAPCVAGQGVRITTGSRLHFGLLNTAPPFGGVGVMINQPQTQISLRPAPAFHCSDQIIDRVLPIAQRIQQYTSQDKLPPCEISLVQCSAAHAGLGSGTQLTMAVAEALARFAGLQLSATELICSIADRGKRSAIGVHGYWRGGLIYEDADPTCHVNPLQQRVLVPTSWRVALFVPPNLPPQVSGQLEQKHFAKLAPAATEQQQELRRLITERIMSATSAGDFASFADAVHQYNHQSGELFASVQGGAYNGPAVTNLINTLIRRGAVGVGQSSWGPTVFAWFPSQIAADRFCQDLPSEVSLSTITDVMNQARTCE